MLQYAIECVGSPFAETRPAACHVDQGVHRAHGKRVQCKQEEENLLEARDQTAPQGPDTCRAQPVPVLSLVDRGTISHLRIALWLRLYYITHVPRLQ